MLLCLRIPKGPLNARYYSIMAPVNIKVAANDFLDFVNASPTPFHAVKSVKERLSKVGFKEIKVRSSNFRTTLQLIDIAIRRRNLGPLPAYPAVNTS